MNSAQYNLVRYDDKVDVAAAPRLVVFNHIAKTGGTTLSNILRDNLDDVFFNLESIKDWGKVKTEVDKLSDQKVLLEGHAWGAHEMFSSVRPVFYLTTLRDPAAVFRSNFSYAINHYSVLDGLEHYIENYTGNGMVQSLGYGSLELAKERLEHSYAAFTVLEEYKESVRQVAHRLEFDVSEYEIKNRSGSESLDLSNKMLGKLHRKISDDLRLHDFALNLVKKRSVEISAIPSHASLAPPVEEKRTETSFPDEYRRRSEFAIELIGKGAYREAIVELKSIEVVDFAVMKSLADCYGRLGEHELACEWHEKTYQIHPSFVFRDYVNSLRRWDPERALAVVDGMVADIDNVLYSETSDSQSFREKISTIRLKMEINSECGELEKLADVYQDMQAELNVRREGISRHTSFDHLPLQFAFEYAGLLRNNAKTDLALKTLDHALNKVSWNTSGYWARRMRLRLMIRNLWFGVCAGKFIAPLFLLIGAGVKAPNIFAEMVTDVINRRIRGAG